MMKTICDWTLEDERPLWHLADIPKRPSDVCFCG
jgi:hypothetical protein